MRTSTMCRVKSKFQGLFYSVKNNGDVMCFKQFDEAWKYAIDPIDEASLGLVELITITGAAPGPQTPFHFTPDPKDRQPVLAALAMMDPFEGNN